MEPCEALLLLLIAASQHATNVVVLPVVPRMTSQKQCNRKA